MYLTFTGLMNCLMTSAQRSRGFLRCSWRYLFRVDAILLQLNRRTYLTVSENGDLRVIFGSR